MPERKKTYQPEIHPLSFHAFSMAHLANQCNSVTKSVIWLKLTMSWITSDRRVKTRSSMPFVDLRRSKSDLDRGSRGYWRILQNMQMSADMG